MSQRIFPRGNRLIPTLGFVCAFTGLWFAAASASPTEVSDQTQTVHPKEIVGPLPNPYMGWGIWAGPRYLTGRLVSMRENTTDFGQVDPAFDWVLVDWIWSDLEPQEGQYEWGGLDQVVNYWAARGKQIYIRAWITDDSGWDGAPGSEVVPDWVWQAGAKYHEYTGLGHTAKREPAYADPSYESIYLPRAKRFLCALADRYDKPDGPVFLWGVMGYGNWGEWHVLESHYAWPDVETKHRVLTQLIDFYADTYKNNPLVIAYCFDSDEKQVTSLDDFLYRQGFDEAIRRHFALERRGFIDGLRLWDKDLMKSNWSHSPMSAEGNWTYTDVKNQLNHGTMEEHLKIFEEWHSNFAHLYMDAPSYKRAMREDHAVIDESLRAGGIGFRLVPTSLDFPKAVPAGNLLVVKQEWINENVGRLYQRLPLAFFFFDRNGKQAYVVKDEAFDETTWVKGTTYLNISSVRIDRTLRPGDYEVRIGLVDAKFDSRIALGIAGDDGHKRYNIGSIHILPPTATAHLMPQEAPHPQPVNGATR
jgi:gamma-glutamylcyclotransferase (GGCT)/AIG2-like uncharacterized protein YtfP